MSALSVTGVIPVYNHEQAVPAVAVGLRAHGLPVVLVDDGSNESCRIALEQLTRITGDRLVRLPVNGGKGAAVIAGLREALAQGFTHALQVDADGQHDLRDVPKFLAAARAEPEAVICGRPVFDASIPKVRFLSRYITHALVWLQTLSFSAVRDSMCGFRLYPLRWIDTKVSYPTDGISHFRMLYDNLRLAGMHVRLVLGMLWRAPLLVWRRMRR